MGLSAVVLHPDAEGSLEPDFTLAEVHLGNISMIAHLRERTSQSLPGRSLIIDRVLNSATHSGDVLEPDLFLAVREELLALMTDDDRDVRRFCESMKVLLDAATEHQLPIMFV